MDYKAKNVKPPSEMNLCTCAGPCTCLPCLPYLQVSEDGNYPDSHCPPNPGCLPNGQYEVCDASVISDTPTCEEWYRVYPRNWALHTEEPRRNLENAPKIVYLAHLKYSESNFKDLFLNTLYINNFIVISLRAWKAVQRYTTYRPRYRLFKNYIDRTLQNLCNDV